MNQSMKQMSEKHSRVSSTPVVVKMGQQSWTIGNSFDEDIDVPIWSRDGDKPNSAIRAGRTKPNSWGQSVKRAMAGTLAAAAHLIQSDGQIEPGKQERRRHRVPSHGRPSPLHRFRRNRLRESFQAGLIAGLVLGCLSLVMFHHVEPSNVSQRISTPAVSATATARITTPAVFVDAVIAAKGTSSSSHQVTLKLQQHHLDSVSLPTKQGTAVVTGVALSTSDLAPRLKQTRRVVPSAHVVQLRVVSAEMPAAASFSQTDAQAVTRWLSAVGSAVNTIVAASADGANLRDAQAAYKSAQKLQPDAKLLQASGYQTEFEQLRLNVRSAYQSLAHHQMAKANLSAEQALSMLMTFGLHKTVG